ncbi:MAG: CinA family protein [Coprothermobacterota bacterium]|nr:CinA family protein [Coprothermobacterota bacterium]
MHCTLILLSEGEEELTHFRAGLGEAGHFPDRIVRLGRESLLAQELSIGLDRGNTVLCDPAGRARSLVARLPLRLLGEISDSSLFLTEGDAFLLVAQSQPDWPALRPLLEERRPSRFARLLHCFPAPPALLQEWPHGWPPVQVEPYRGRWRLWLLAEGEGRAAVESLDRLEGWLREARPSSYLGHSTLPLAVGESLLARGLQLAVAESCTGGLLSHLLTEMPGASAYFRQGLVVYSNEAKMALLGIPVSSLEVDGVVSASVAEELAQRVRHQAGADLALGITGLAGPGGGTLEKPVGTVYLALAGPEGVRSSLLQLAGNRSQIQDQAANWALLILWRWLQRAPLPNHES